MLLIKLLIAHTITDFFYRPDIDKINASDEPEKERRKIKHLLLHTFLTFLGVSIVFFDFSMWKPVLFITLTHFLIDAFKIYMTEDKPIDFVMDQILHIAVLLWVSASYNPAIAVFLASLINNEKVMLVILGYLLVSFPTGIAVGILTKDLAKQIDNGDGYEEAGKWIGMLERILILTFILINQISAIGLLVGAKSVLRFSEKGNKENITKRTEYILIGTFLSFGIALAIGLSIKAFLKF